MNNSWIVASKNDGTFHRYENELAVEYLVECFFCFVFLYFELLLDVFSTWLVSPVEFCVALARY